MARNRIALLVCLLSWDLAQGAEDLRAQTRCAVPLVMQSLGKLGLERPVRATRAARQAPAPVTREFWAWDLTVMPPGFRRVPTTLRAEGPRGLVYVEDAEWGKTIDQAAVDTILATFETRTPRHPELGIADVDTAAFGEIPAGLDGDSRVVLLFAKLGRFQGQGFDGFFNAFDTMTEAEAWSRYEQHSNECNVLYLNTDGSPPASDYMLAVVAHELVHLQAHPYDPEEMAWVGETLGEAGMLLCGYDTDQAHARRYASKPSTPLVTEPYVSYGACLFLAAAMADQQPAGFLKRLTAEPLQGMAGVERTLESFGPSDGFEGLYERWVASNYVTGAGGTAPDYTYSSVHVPQMAATAVPASGLAPLEGRMQATGVVYLRFESGGEYTLRLESDGPAGMRALHLSSPATAAAAAAPLAFQRAQQASLSVGTGDVVAFYGLAPGVYRYRVSVAPAGH
ncbi:MAG: hypothetical protein HY816_06680 [Candidatus Wallbacteria bacterium]|nr:hypothetical protein [Candidatus Wallbacteria bacterium]